MFACAWAKEQMIKVIPSAPDVNNDKKSWKRAHIRRSLKSIFKKRRSVYLNN